MTSREPKTPSNRSLLASLLPILTLGTAHTVYAANTQDALKTITITATKTGATNIVRTPMSIQALQGSQLQNMGALDFSDYARSIPGLSVFDQGPGNKRYIIRGINSAGASTVGLYLDGVDITGENEQDGGGLEPDIRLFDIKRVEVLKGPQGTTFGSSALAGLVRYITNKPDLDQYGGYARAAVTSRRGASLGENTDAAVNLPLVPGKFAMRIAGYYQNQPGFISNPFIGGSNNDIARAGRIEATWKINSRTSLFVMGMIQNAYSASPDFYDPYAFSQLPNVVTTGAPLKQFTNADIVRAPFTDNMSLGEAQLIERFDVGTFTLTASGTHRNTTFNRDASQVVGGVYGLSAFQEGVRSQITQPLHRTVDSVEARFASTLQGPLQFLAGLYFQREIRHFRSSILTADALGYPDPTSGALFGYDLLDRKLLTRIDEKAAYGELNFKASKHWKLLAGFRVFRFDIGSQPDVLVNFGGSPGSGVGDYSKSHEVSAIGRFNVSYDFSEHSMMYAQVAQGYRPGGVNDQGAASLVHVTIPAGFNSDSLVNYEVGYKSVALQHRLIVTSAAYFTDWKDIQISEQATNGTGQSFPYTGNAGGARVYGAELELEALPVNGLKVSLSGGYTNAKIDQSTPNGGRNGDRIPYVPEWSLDAGSTYNFPINDTWDGFVGADVSWQDNRKTDLPENTATYFNLPSYWITNAHVGVDNGPWDVSFIVKNLFDTNKITDYFVTSAGLAENGLIPTIPRTFMLQVTRHF
jgi:iron complex outermembrane receptor protein